MIDPKVSAPLRQMLGHVTRHELDALRELVDAAGPDVCGAALELCVPTCGYVAIQVSGRWPEETDLRQIAAHTARSMTGLDVSESEIGAYLTRSVFGFEPLEVAIPDPQRFGVIALFTTASVLVSFCPPELDWSGYLDQIWNAIEAARQTRIEVLPALMYQLNSEVARASQSVRQSAG